jgi:transposase
MGGYDGGSSMARYKDVDTGMKLLAVDLSRQLLPGTFEHALSHLLDHELDLSHFDAHYSNDVAGCRAYPPAMLLKVVLFAYSQGMVSSRSIERACRDHVTFMALSGDSAPHFTTIADFVSSRQEEIARLFAAVLAICLRQGLVGHEMFAIDGVKLPSNASKAKSGTREEFQKQLTKLEAAAAIMLQRHREQDDKGVEPGLDAKAQQRLVRLQRDAAQVKDWLAIHPDRKGSSGSIRKSNRTDNESAKMATSKGHSVLHRRRGGGCQAPDHCRGAGPWHRFRTRTAAAGGGCHEGSAQAHHRTHGRLGLSQREEPAGAGRSEH